MKPFFLLILSSLIATTTHGQGKEQHDPCTLNAPLWLAKHIKFDSKKGAGQVQFQDARRTRYSFTFDGSQPGRYQYTITRPGQSAIVMEVDTGSGTVNLLVEGKKPETLSNCHYPGIALPSGKASAIYAGLLAYGFTRGLGLSDVDWVNDCNLNSPKGKEAARYPLLIISFSRLELIRMDGEARAKKVLGLSHKNMAEGSLAFNDGGFVASFSSFQVAAPDVPAAYRTFCE